MAKVLLAIPTEGGINERTSAIAARLSQRADVDYISAKGRPSDYVRNNIFHMFESANKLAHLFLLDSDIEPPLDCLDRLLALDAPLAVGCYPVLMPDGLRWALANKGTDRHYRLLEWLPSIDKPFEVDAGGAGCLLIRKDVLGKVRWPYFKWIEKADGSQVGEDIYFFKKCNAAGLRVKVDPLVLCNHFKVINLTILMRNKMKNRKEK